MDKLKFCVIDPKMLYQTESRQFLMALYVGTGEGRMATTPDVAQAVVNGLIAKEMQSLRQQGVAASEGWTSAVHRAVESWVHDVFLGEGGAFAIRNAANVSRREDWTDRFPHYAFHSLTPGYSDIDKDTLADALDSGAREVVSNASDRMFFHVLNEWALREGERPESFLLRPAEAVARLLQRHGRTFPNVSFLHQCAVNMVIEVPRQPPEKERSKLRQFAESLNESMPGIGNAIAVEKSDPRREARWDRAEAIISDDTAWQRIREIEAKLVETLAGLRKDISDSV